MHDNTRPPIREKDISCPIRKLLAQMNIYQLYIYSSCLWVRCYNSSSYQV